MNVRPVGTSDYAAFKKLFCDYYTELDCDENPLPLFDDWLLPDLKAGLFQVAVCEEGGAIAGFVIYQIDDILNDWNFKEGCGDVRELYVAPPFRRRGLGTALLQFAENTLVKSGATEVYTLPVEECESFFIKHGYVDSGEYCADADNKVFGKNMDKSDF